MLVRSWVAISLLMLLALTGCGPAEPEARVARAELGGDSPLLAHFRQAEQERGVPAELLATIAYVQTRLSPPPFEEHGHERDAHHAPREHGIMAIGTGGLTSLEVAAMLVGLSPETVASDDGANVRAAAALIEKIAHARGVDFGAGFETWAPAVEAYGGEALWREVKRLLEAGFSARDTHGFALELSGAGLGEALGVTSLALGYPGSIWNPAYGGNYTNASRGAAQINYVIIHTVQGSYSGCISWFKNPSAQVSAHYVVRSSDGEITQMVDDADVAWHDGCFNSETIGIEHEGYVSDPGKWYTDAMYTASAKLTAWLCDQYGIPKTRQHIMGHGEAPDCSDHTDPGSGWDWDKYMALVVNGGCNPSGEICNGKDDDCDGQTDEDGVCNKPPVGYLDESGCEAIKGWSQDPDEPAKSIDVHLYFGGPAGSGAAAKSVSANVSRDDLCAAIGSCEHGFELRPPRSLFDGQPHPVHAYGIDSAGGANPELADSPKALSCATPSVSGVRRHVIDPTSFAAWKFDLFWHALPLGDAAIEALPEGDPLPAAPELAKADDGSPEVWLVDGAHRRHVTSPQSMAEWQLSFGDVVEKPAAELAALELGPPLRNHPVLVVHSSGKVELVDDPFGAEPGSSGSGGSGSTSGAGGTKRGGAGQKSSVIDDGEVDGGCACRAGQGRDRSARGWLLSLLALVLGRRRKVWS